MLDCLLELFDALQLLGCGINLLLHLVDVCLHPLDEFITLLNLLVEVVNCRSVIGRHRHIIAAFDLGVPLSHLTLQVLDGGVQFFNLFVQLIGILVANLHRFESAFQTFLLDIELFLLSLKFSNLRSEVVGTGLCLTPVGLIDLHLLLGLLNVLLGLFNHCHELLTFFLPVALKHIDDGLSMLVHELSGLIGKLGIDGILFLFIDFDMDFILLITFVLSHILILAEGVHEGRGLTIHIIVITVGAKSALDGFEKRHNSTVFVWFVLVVFLIPVALGHHQRNFNLEFT